jgi:hypothetical protein
MKLSHSQNTYSNIDLHVSPSPHSAMESQLTPQGDLRIERIISSSPTPVSDDPVTPTTQDLLQSFALPRDRFNAATLANAQLNQSKNLRHALAEPPVKDAMTLLEQALGRGAVRFEDGESFYLAHYVVQAATRPETVSPSQETTIRKTRSLAPPPMEQDDDIIFVKEQPRSEPAMPYSSPQLRVPVNTPQPIAANARRGLTARILELHTMATDSDETEIEVIDLTWEKRRGWDVIFYCLVA